MNEFDNTFPQTETPQEPVYQAPVEPQEPVYQAPVEPQQPVYQAAPQYQAPTQPAYQAQPQFNQAAYAAPQGGRLPSKSKEKLVAGLLAIFLGTLGIHKFYLGYTKAGVIMLLVSIIGAFAVGIGPGIMAVIGLVEGIMYLTKSDDEFDSTYVVGDKQWF